MDKKRVLVFATQNENKAKEIQGLLPSNIVVKTLKDIECDQDIPEEQDTLEGNALQKAEYVKEHFGFDCFADDTGLEVEALNGEPGVFSARYAGSEKDSEANMNKLLDNLNDKPNRSAQFRTVVALIMDGETHTFEGVVKGEISHERKGGKGFGYDPIFVPEGKKHSFAEMDLNDKNEISHRARAIEKLCNFLVQ